MTDAARGRADDLCRWAADWRFSLEPVSVRTTDSDLPGSSVQSSASTARFGRIAVLLCVAALAFAAGMAMRTWSGGTDESGAVAPAVATPLDGQRTPREIRLVGADPGALRRPIRPRRSSAARPGAPTVVITRPAPTPRQPSRAAGGSFDSSGKSPSQGTTFDSTG